MKLPVLAVILTAVMAMPAAAGDVEIVGAKAKSTGGGTYSFTVTLKHGDEGWEHYADGWDVLGPGDAVLGKRVLHHPHVDEQPFTRGLPGVAVPAGVKTVRIRAHDKVHGNADKTFEVTLPGR